MFSILFTIHCIIACREDSVKGRQICQTEETVRPDAWNAGSDSLYCKKTVLKTAVHFFNPVIIIIQILPGSEYPQNLSIQDRCDRPVPEVRSEH